MNPLFAFDGVQTMAEDALLPPLPACPLCGDGPWSPIFTVQATPEVTLNHCARCRGASVSRMPRQEALNAFYSGFYTTFEGDHITFDDAARFGRHLYRYTRLLETQEDLRILDFGGGDGSIAAALADQLVLAGVGRVAVVVADYGDGRARPRRAAVQVDRVPGLELVEPGWADVVLASGVLEHVPDPMSVARALLKRLRRGGLFYARTPHVLPFMELYRRRAVERFFPFPAHLHDLGQAFWSGCFRRRALGEEATLVASRPAIVQASFRQHGCIAMASHLAKTPWYLLGSHYPFVGGWEFVVRRG